MEWIYLLVTRISYVIFNKVMNMRGFETCGKFLDYLRVC
jgi:hypothetical protein